MAPRNPLRATWDYLRGADLQVQTAARPVGPASSASPVTRAGGPETERKFIYYDGIGEAIRMGTLVHGPMATELLGQAFGNWGQDANSAVFACLKYLCQSYPAAPLRVYRGDAEGGAPDVLVDHPLEQLFAKPSPFLTGPELWYWVQWAKHVMGNAYVRKLRAGDADTGNVVQLQPISPSVITPVTTDQDRKRGIAISYYRHEYETGRYEQIPAANLLHFRLGIDDYDHRLGCAPLKRLVRSIATDEEAEKFCLSLLSNYAVPGLLVMTNDPDMTEEQARAIKDKVASNFGGSGRGNVGVLNNGAKAEQFGFSPDQMDTSGVRRAAEERIAAVLGVPATLVGLGAGLDRSIYNNVREAREGFTENTLLPLYVFDAASVDLQLLGDFTSDPRVFTRFDSSNLRALQEDTNQIWARTTTAYEKKVLTRNEARGELGFLPVDGGDDFAAPPAPPPLPGTAPGDQQTQPPAAGVAGAGGTKALSAAETKARRIDPQRFPALFAAMVDLAAPALEQEMASYFEGQRRRVVGRLLSDRLDAGTADPATARAALPRL